MTDRQEKRRGQSSRPRLSWGGPEPGMCWDGWLTAGAADPAQDREDARAKKMCRLLLGLGGAALWVSYRCRG